MTMHPRVALFCETFNEINGVALTVRQLVAFAKRSERPFLTVHGGPQLARFEEGSVTRLELPRGWVGFGIERDLRYDLLLWRHIRKVREEILKFCPDIIHVTSPRELRPLSVYLAHNLRMHTVD